MTCDANLSASPSPDSDPRPRTGRMFAYLDLVRAPNVFTAAADVAMGYLVTHVAFAQQTPRAALFCGLLVSASCLLYMAGMVLNDVFDAAADTRDRPERPIPSGRVSLRAASVFGWALLVCGVTFAWLVAYFADNWRPGVVGSLLAGCVVLYDGVVKETPLGPAVMASCRGLNVLLGMSLLADATSGGPVAWTEPHWLIAGGIAVYTYGVTQLAREETQARRIGLSVGTAVLLGGMAMLTTLPRVVAAMAPNLSKWQLLWGVLMAMVGWRCIWAIADPRPPLVRAAVKHAILSIIFLDAAVTAGICGSWWGIAVLSLVVPAMVLGKWFEST